MRIKLVLAFIVVSLTVVFSTLTVTSSLYAGTQTELPSLGNDLQTLAQMANPPADGTPIRITIPVIGVDATIVGVPRVSNTWEASHLTWQAGHMEGTAYPGQNSNVVVVAHRYVGYDPTTLQPSVPGPFLLLDRLSSEDRIYLHTDEHIYTYVVTEQLRVSRTDLWVIDPTPIEMLTLMTCDTWDAESMHFVQLLVVRARLTDVSLRTDESLSVGSTYTSPEVSPEPTWAAQLFQLLASCWEHVAEA